MKVEDEIFKLLTKDPENTKIAHITTASKPKANPEYNASTDSFGVEDGCCPRDL